MASDEDQDGGMKLPTGGRVLAALEGGAQVEERRRSRKGAARGPSGGLRGGRKGHVQVRAPHRVSGDQATAWRASCESGCFPVLLSELFAQERWAFPLWKQRVGQEGRSGFQRPVWAASREPQSAPASSPKSPKVKPFTRRVI